MKELVEAAVEAAARSGVRASVIVIDAKNGSDQAVQESHELQELRDLTHQLQAKLLATEGELADVKVKSDPRFLLAKDARIAELNAQLKETSKTAAEAVRRASEVEKAMQEAADKPATAEDAEAQEELQRAVSRIAELESLLQSRDAVCPDEGSTTVQPITDNVDSQGVDILGLEKKHARKFIKLGWKTVGELRTAFLAGEVKAKAGLKKDDVITVGEKLINAAVSLSPSKLAVEVKSDVPDGIKPPTWTQVLSAAKRKRDEVALCQAEMDKLQSEITGCEDSLSGSLNARLDEVKLQRDVYHAQVLAFAWMLGLDHKAGDLDSALTNAGLAELV